MDETIERIKMVMEYYSMDKTMFCDKVGIHTVTLEHIFKGQQKQLLFVLKRITTSCTIINPDWLVLGKGKMLRT